MRELRLTVTRSINEEFRQHFCPSMEVGKDVKHPDGYMVRVVDGCYLDPTYGRVSNWWTWRRIKEDGSLGRKVSGYGW